MLHKDELYITWTVGKSWQSLGTKCKLLTKQDEKTHWMNNDKVFDAASS
jgi:hypothetical protein